MVEEILESVNLNESLKGFSYKEFFNKLIPQAFNMLSVSFKYIAGMVEIN